MTLSDKAKEDQKEKEFKSKKMEALKEIKS
jgi:hypothetical protein